MADSGHVGVAEGYTLQSASCKLVEVDETLLSYLVKGGGQLCFKGTGTDPIVVATGDATYAVQAVETSNTMFVCRNAKIAGVGTLSSPDGTELSLQAHCRVGGVMQVRQRTAMRMSTKLLVSRRFSRRFHS